MDERTARLLVGLTSDFYRRFAGSFSDTRQGAWTGWGRCLEVVRAQLPGARDGGDVDELDVLDLACGNLRFEQFFAEAVAPARVRFHAFDDCDELAQPRSGETHGGSDPAAASAFGEAPALDACAGAPLEVDYRHLDVMDSLFRGVRLVDVLGAPLCDLSVCFGFLHHMPLPEQRVEVLRALVEKTRPGGLVAVSFWCFLDDPRFADKARAEHARAAAALDLPLLPVNDCVLSWQNNPDAHRYCHSFTQDEIDALVGSVSARAQEVARFRADGKTGAMNTYVVLRAL